MKKPLILFPNFQKQFTNRHYVCFSKNGSIPALYNLPSYIYVHNSNDSDPMIVGLRFLKFLLSNNLSLGNGEFTFGDVTESKWNTIFPPKTENQELLDSLLLVDTLFEDIKVQLCTESGISPNVLVVDEAQQLLRCKFIYSWENEICYYNLLTLLRIAVCYFNFTFKEKKLLLIVSSTSSSVIPFLPRSSIKKTKVVDSTAFRSDRYQDFFQFYNNLPPYIYSTFQTYHLLDVEELPYTHGRPMWSVEYQDYKDGFSSLVLSKLVGGKEIFEHMYEPGGIIAAPTYAFLMSLIFQRVSLLEPHIRSFSPEIVGKHCVPASHFDIEELCFAISSPEEPALAAGSAYLVWKYPNLETEIWKFLFNHIAPTPPEKGNIGELCSLEGLLLKTDKFKMSEKKLNSNSPSSLVKEFFDAFLNPIPLVEFLEFLGLDVSEQVKAYLKNCFISGISCRRAPKYPLFEDLPKLYRHGTMFYTSSCSTRQDFGIIMYDKKTNTYSIISGEIKNHFDPPCPETILDGIRIQKDTRVILLISNDNVNDPFAIYDEKTKLVRIFLTFKILGIKDYSLAPSDIFSKCCFGDLAVTSWEKKEGEWDQNEQERFNEGYKHDPWHCSYIETKVGSRSLEYIREKWAPQFLSDIENLNYLEKVDYYDLLFLRKYMGLALTSKKKATIIEEISMVESLF